MIKDAGSRCGAPRGTGAVRPDVPFLRRGRPDVPAKDSGVGLLCGKVTGALMDLQPATVQPLGAC